MQLERLEQQNERRMANARYLNQQLAEIEGIEPLRWDQRATKHSNHLYILRYGAKHFGGMHRDRFVEALVAEGIPAFSGYTFPIYANPMFLNKEFYTKGCPLTCRHYDRDVDFAAYAETCPVTERACYEESVWLEQRLLLGNKKDMDDIIKAILKIGTNAHELG